MNLQFIKYFVALAETENFTKAAEKTFVVQSTFSAGIKKLEIHLDCPLFYRDKRNVRLTDEGKTLLPKAHRLLSVWNQIEYDFDKFENKKLKIGLLHNIMMDAVLPRISRFKNQFIDYSLSLEEGDKPTLIERLSKEELDCIMVKEGGIDEEVFDTAFLYEEKLMLAISSTHPLACKTKIEFKMLQNLSFIQRNTCPLFGEVHQEFQKRNIKINPVFSTENDETVRGLIASGVGCSLLSKPAKPKQNVVYIPISDAEFISRVALVWKKANPSANLKKFIAI